MLSAVGPAEREVSATTTRLVRPPTFGKMGSFAADGRAICDPGLLLGLISVLVVLAEPLAFKRPPTSKDFWW